MGALHGRRVRAGGINVNAVNGGIIESDSLRPTSTACRAWPPLSGVLPLIPKQRMGTAQEVADWSPSCCTPAAEYVTGQTLVVDGGLSDRRAAVPRRAT